MEWFQGSRKLFASSHLVQGCPRVQDPKELSDLKSAMTRANPFNRGLHQEEGSEEGLVGEVRQSPHQDSIQRRDFTAEL